MVCGDYGAKVTIGDHFLNMTRIIGVHYHCELLLNNFLTGGTAHRHYFIHYYYELLVYTTMLHRHTSTLIPSFKMFNFISANYLRLFFCAFYALRGFFSFPASWFSFSG